MKAMKMGLLSIVLMTGAVWAAGPLTFEERVKAQEGDPLVNRPLVNLDNNSPSMLDACPDGNDYCSPFILGECTGGATLGYICPTGDVDWWRFNAFRSGTALKHGR